MTSLISVGIIVLIIALFWAFTRFYLGGENLVKYERSTAATVDHSPLQPSQEHHNVIQFLRDLHGSRGKGGVPLNLMRRNRDGAVHPALAMMRQNLEVFSRNTDLNGLTIQPAMADGVAAEWVLAEDANPAKRLLYIHGGGFITGSPVSHRPITTRLARTQGFSVLAIDYRLMPENGRLDCLADSQTAYRWLLDNGPTGSSPVSTLFVAGDSAGGNLCLAVAQWARDQGLQAADGLIALSPVTDSTLSGPSLKANLKTDYMLGPSFGKMLTMPRALYLWMTWLTGGIRPCDPRISPVHGDLANLPPTLIHASCHEMLFDDASRYVAKANACGSSTTLEVWPHMVHVWHLFTDKLPEAQVAFTHIEDFIAANSSD